MTQRNITGGFQITGIYPFNRSALEVNDGKQEGKQDTSQQLLKETGLAYIPMYSTEEGSRSRESPDLEDEPPRLERSLSEGDLSRTLTPLRRKTAIEDFLKTPPHPSCLPTKNPKCCGRVVTSFEYMEIMEEKEKKKLEAIKEKERRKIEKIESQKAAKKIKELKKNASESLLHN